MGSFRTPARVRAAGTSVASRWMQVWLVAAGERCVSSRATTSTGTPRRISPDDHPYRARWHVSSLLHAADRAGADQGSDRRNAAVSVPVAWRPSPVRAGASCTCSWTTRPWPDAGQRWRAPGLGSPTSASLVHAHMVGAWWAAVRALPPHVPLVASEHNQMSWPAGDHTPRAQDAARRAGLFFARGPSARAWAARIGLDDGRLRDGRSSVEGLSATALPGLPSPRLTFAGRLRGDKAPDVLIEALALIDAPPPAYLVGDGPAARPADPADPGPRAGSCRLTGHRYSTCPARPCRSQRRR